MLFLTTFLGNTQENTPTISLLTFDTGLESYSLFGHTALRVQNPKTRQDIVYNFGMFDFDTPNFLLKFIKGELQYKVGIEKCKPMLRAYQSVNRQVSEQILHFTPEQTLQIIQKLETAYRPENRYYRYGFLSRNCSTEIRDIIFKNTPGLAYTPTETGFSYRHYLKNYSQPMPWLKFGINLALGSNIDKKINTHELMFLPDYLATEVEKAKVNNETLAGLGKKLLKNIEKPQPSPWMITPFLVFSFLFVLMVLGKSETLKKAFVLAVGIGGLIILTINLISGHPEVHDNYNLLWMNPLYLVLFGLNFASAEKIKKVLHFVLLACLVATLGVWILKIQGHVNAFFPIVISLFWIHLKQLQKA